jgi:hypothetical protein
MIAATLLFPIAAMLAQAAPAPMPPPAAAPMQAAPMQAGPAPGGPCQDSARAVPFVLQAPIGHAMQIVRIDKVESTAQMMPGEVLGFLYTTQDGTTWLGQRTSDYMSPADATAINLVLASTHTPGVNVTEFPPQSKYGVPTKYKQYFPVLIPEAAMMPLKIQLVPCVAWPAGQELPHPTM